MYTIKPKRNWGHTEWLEYKRECNARGVDIDVKAEEVKDYRKNPHINKRGSN